jgi:precorrin-8X/cobalt-precorrin-8 methylmutase
MNFDKSLLKKIAWDMPAMDIEQESFRRIEAEANNMPEDPAEYKVARRLIHTTADFSIVEMLAFSNAPVAACIKALKSGATIYSDSNMIKSGISVAKLKLFNKSYTRDSIHCYIADPEVANFAKEKNISRALASLEKARNILDGSIVLTGNAPLALAGIVRLYVEENIKPALVIGMPVGFVNVEESKELLAATDLPHVMLTGRRGGSPLAVATLHAMMESGM